ncbi:serine/threonine-protein phosphatase 6 regulatory ankyrin repeat subunit B-like [Ruditapes philippinarum]|uniref:serine/threonine-protein phosphatase 6 regulatory ankyrin repeat subunit B-like n=1 Tax=Ruditapes philippinarum TaxID=129788 RepID=UPI00295A9CEE|nr:serine/threonine-protein phosphatase 6 regulatory ankyrin repeat subunit B-like [Ruditapes philippinarum]
MADENERNGIATFFRYAQNGHFNKCESLLNKNPNLLIEKNRKREETLLHVVARYLEDERIVRMLLCRQEVDVNARDYWGQTPLHLATRVRNISLITCLLKSRKIDVNIKDANGYNPLHVLVLSKHELDESFYDTDEISDSWKEGIQLLVDANVDINSRTNNGQNILHLAASKTCAERFVVYILQHYSVVEWSATNASGENFLHVLFGNISDEYEVLENILPNLGTYLGNKTVLKNMLNQKDVLGVPPWFTLIHTLKYFIEKDTDCLETIFTQYKASINATDNLGNTILHRLVGSFGASLVCKTIISLLKHNLDVNARNVFGEAAISELHMDAVFEILKLQNCDFKSRNRWGRIPFQCIINLHPMPNFIERMLRENCFELDSQDIYGSTALHFAAYNGYEEQVELLLKYGANVDLVDSLNDTPFETAKRHGNFKCMKLIFDTANLYEREKKETFQLYKASEEITLTTLLKNQNLRGNLQNFPKDFKQYCEYLLKARRTYTLARPSEEHAQDNDVITAVRHHIEQICQYVNEYDSRFQMTIFPTGSTVEGTKVGRPDEFDFVLCLQRLSRYCVIQSTEPYHPGYALLKFKNKPVPEGFLSFSDSEGYFQALPFLNYLFKYIKRALKERKLWEKGNLYYRYEDNLHVISGKPVFNFQIYWIGSKHKQIALSIDLVPGVYKRGWWPKKACPETMKLVSDRVIDEGCFLLLQTKNNDFNDKWYYMNDVINDSVGSTQDVCQDTHGNKMLRVSVAPAEISLMKSLPEIYRRAYALAKIVKSPEICPSVHIDRPPLSNKYK